jgi:predicted nucleic acid-binding protein
VLIGEVDLLPRLYGEVLIPDVVARELSDSEAPPAVAKWASRLPSWIDVRPTPVSVEKFEKLDDGERAAILLAEAQSAPELLLIDDADGRAEAERRHISAVGTLGILRAGALRNLTELPSALVRLRSTNFRCATALIDELLAEDAQRRRGERPA